MRVFLRNGVLLFALMACSIPSSSAGESSRVTIVISRNLAPYQETVKEIEVEFLRRDIDVELSYYQLSGAVEKGEDVLEKMHEEGSKIAVTIGTEAFLAMKPHMNSIQVVAAMIYDPMGEGLLDGIEDLETVSGAYLKVPYVIQFALLQEIMPEIKKLSLIYFLNRKEALAEVRAAASQNSMEIVAFGIKKLKDFLPTLDQARSNSDAFLMVLDQDLYSTSTSRELLLFSARNRFPVIAFSPNYVESGALISFSADYRNNGRAAAQKVVQILKGENVKSHWMPPQELVVAWNQRTANALEISLTKEGRNKINVFF